MVTIFERRGIAYLDFDPRASHEWKDRHPALATSNNLFNRVNSLTMAYPITYTDRSHPFHLRLDERTRTDGVILCDQAQMLDLNSRYASFVEHAPEDISSEAVDMTIGFLEPKQRKEPRRTTSSVAVPHLIFENAGGLLHGHRPYVPGPYASSGTSGAASGRYADQSRWHRKRTTPGRYGPCCGTAEGHIGRYPRGISSDTSVYVGGA